MKRFLAVLLVIALLFPLAACESKEETGEKVRDEVTTTVNDFMGNVKSMDFASANNYLTEDSEKLDDSNFGNLDEESREFVSIALENMTYDINAVNVDSNDAAMVDLTISAMKLNLSNSIYAAFTGEGMENQTVETSLKIPAVKEKNSDGEKVWLLKIDGSEFSNAIVNQ